MSTGTRPLQQQHGNVKVNTRQVLRRTQPKVTPGRQQQQQQHTPVKPSPILKKVSSFDNVIMSSPGTTDSDGAVDYQSPLRQDGLIMDPPTPLFFSFTYGLYSDSNHNSIPNSNRVILPDEESSSSCSSTVDDPSPPPRKLVVCERKKKVTFAVPEAVAFTEKKGPPTPPASPTVVSVRKLNSKVQSTYSFGKKQGPPKFGRIAPEGLVDLSPSEPGVMKRCAWITSQSDPAYIDYHDSEWGVPVHDDKKLFELLVFSGAQAELSWSAILSKREHYRAVFAGFDPELVSKFDEEKIASLAADPEILQHEGKLRQIVDNAKCVVEVVQEFGSFDKFIWNFFGYKPIVNKYRTAQQVPIKSSKSDFISRELMKRGFRFVGPTITYSFMQSAGMTNDHILQCFRHEECIELSQNETVAGSSTRSRETSSSSNETESEVQVCKAA